ncbi:uncharacterized protein DUF262 [Isoptericola sp. CG 20/1183]|uniref:Uncharacterized protein DUF262 n=1 Tax=Isoptericola halotolerans TaxID=300560 RepID=A0ABX5EDV4_9MICO|nr:MULTISPECIES: DUF262 domain-containing protein [Isoptericola]PRZ03861.1 uncharacterized protein DUF262 [Isoptericola sp. CG 20/1183]PRZ04006.1 uncharacterized protein DUF262 [Isoptericola halotolerans]
MQNRNIEDLPVEYDSLGHSTGVEAEEDDPNNETIDEPFDPAKIDVVTRTPTVSLLLARLRRGVLDLTPDFQRRAGIWTDVAQSRLIESLLLRIPLPTLYAAESGEDSWVVVDGIQRLTTIARFVQPDLIRKDYPNLETLRLTGLEYLGQYEGATYSDLPGNLQTRIDEAELLVHLIRAGTPEPVKFNIFARINTGGLPLTAQELRHALIPGPARQLLAELSRSAEFLHATDGSIRTTRMADREMVLRFLAFLMLDPDEHYRGDLDGFLRDAMELINHTTVEHHEKLGDSFRRSMNAAARIFETNAFRKLNNWEPNRRLPINKALFETISVNLARLSQKNLDLLTSNREEVDMRFRELLQDEDFYNAISVGTGSVEKVRERFKAIDNLFNEMTS